jgi:WzyE protein
MSDEIAVLASCTVSALVWVAVGWAVAQARKDGLHLATIFSLLFAVSYPLKLIATSYGFASLNSVALGEEWRLRALGLANLSAAIFVLPVILRAMPARLDLQPTETPAQERMSAAVGWLLTAMVLLIASYGFDSLWRILSFEALTELREQRDQSRLFSAPTALMRDAGTFCLITHFGIAIRGWERLGRGLRISYVLSCSAVAYVLLAISGSKYMGLLPFAIAILVANAIHIERHGRGFRFTQTAAWGLIAIVGIGLTGYLRGFGEIPTPDGFIVAALIQTAYAFDSPDNLSFILSRTENWWTGDLSFAPTLQYMFLSPIPRAVWAEKPLVMGNQYIMQRYLAERFTDESGEVISPSMAGEMLVSGGFWFVIVWSLILGILVAGVYRWTQTHRGSRLSLAVYTWLCLNVFNLLRSGTGIVSPMVIFTTISAVVLVTSQLAAAVARRAAATEDSPAIARQGFR